MGLDVKKCKQTNDAYHKAYERLIDKMPLEPETKSPAGRCLTAVFELGRKTSPAGEKDAVKREKLISLWKKVPSQCSQEYYKAAEEVSKAAITFIRACYVR